MSTVYTVFFWKNTINNYLAIIKPSRLVDWLRVPTTMRENRVRAWVEVVGSVMEKNHFRIQWNTTGLICPTVVWRPDTALDLASFGQELVMEHPSMRVECAICGRGVTLPDFSSLVFIALTGFPHGVFLSPAQWKGLPSRLIQPHLPSQSQSDRLYASLNG